MSLASGMVRLAKAAGIGAVGAGLLGAAGCAIGGKLSPEAAFALSASALSGTDRFSFDGRLSAYDPDGRLADQAGYRGEVTGHKPAALAWEGTAASSFSSSYWSHPLSLVSYVESGSSEVKAAASNPNEVVLEMKLDPEAARRRIRDELRNQMRAVAEETGVLIADSQGTTISQAKLKIEESNRVLEEALKSLSVTTSCRWTADRRTWFPKKLSEESVLSYTLAGKRYSEKRISETNFERKADSGTIQDVAATK
ncbi:hypothetical protein [Cohnella thailandensis]|uniref:Uncharacterized protein n=1 Tax=Cohnella thailandensis TaxID=557557 RepID=A0A841SYU1_9BACL|nr:hypothetical protein [Cohnella thailandensis]MBB6636432.1 hypothetical protein [Cohnella thailandensis]MBP1973597.1 hypothetical protein [Cohnella thailandensis]